jgi:hypothetical protein
MPQGWERSKWRDSPRDGTCSECLASMLRLPKMGHRERGSPGEGLDRHCGLGSVVLRRSSSAGGDGQDQKSDAHPYYRGEDNVWKVSLRSIRGCLTSWHSSYARRLTWAGVDRSATVEEAGMTGTNRRGDDPAGRDQGSLGHTSQGSLVQAAAVDDHRNPSEAEAGELERHEGCSETPS